MSELHRTNSIPHTASVVALFAAIWTLSPSLVAAQGVAGGTAGSLFPIDGETSVRLASESVRLTPRSDEVDGWRVEVDSELANTSDSSETVTVGFLETDCSTIPHECDEADFDDLSVRVDGETIELRQEQISDDHPAAEHGREGQTVHVFEVDVPPDATVSVRRSLAHGDSKSGPAGNLGLDPGVGFDFTPGADWKGTVGEVRVTVAYPHRPWAFDFSPSAARIDDDRGLELVEYVETLEDGDATTRYAFRAKEWTPAHDFGMQMYTVTTSKYFDVPGGPLADHPIAECPPPFLARWYGHITSDDYDLGDFARILENHYLRDYPAGEEELVAKIAESNSAETLRRCRNAMFAKHGYSFDDDQLDDLFYDWDPEQPDHSKPNRVVVFRKNPHYSPELLTATDRFYVQLIQAAERLKRDE